jgi:deoxyribodipyrimidine photo-lyase
MNVKRPTVTLFWFRRDLRLDVNAGLYHALKNETQVLPIFIFDTNILSLLPAKDARVLFIHQTLEKMKASLQKMGSDLLVLHGDPLEVYKKLFEQYQVNAVYTNHDYEPQAISRDQKIKEFCDSKAVQFLTYKDQCIFEKKEILSDQQKNYTVYTPYKKKWLSGVTNFYLKSYPNDLYQNHFFKVKLPTRMISLKDINFIDFNFSFPHFELSKKMLTQYSEKRDYPALDQGTSHLGLHLRFGTLSVRELAREGKKHSEVWLSELIWREFFMQILWHYPLVEKTSFKMQYEKVAWRNNNAEFQKWCNGETGYPLVDAGMRELNTTGFMHNRSRMVVASFLTKHLLMHWLQGERYFAEKLLDYDLAANNGNWQWAAGTGCDAAPYFRIFNPASQIERFDRDLVYVKKWVPEYGTPQYVKPMVDHTFARDRALSEFKKALK